MIKNFALSLVFVVLACEVTTAVDEDAIANLSFDDIVLGRVLSEIEVQPLFFDFDTGRYMAPPPDILDAEPAQPLELASLKYTDKLKAWIRAEGLDAAFQSDGQSTTLVAFEMKVGTWWDKDKPHTKMTPQTIVEDLKLAKNDNWVTFQEVIPKEKRPGRLPFITREGGIGQLDYLVLGEDFAPDSISMRYQIARLDLSKSSVPSVPEPVILSQFAEFLVASAKDGQLQLRLVAGRGTVTIQKDKVIVSSAAHRDIVAGRIGSGWLDIDAARKRVIVHGHGAEATLRALGDKVRIDMNGKVAYDKKVSISMPKLEVNPLVKWKD